MLRFPVETTETGDREFIPMSRHLINPAQLQQDWETDMATLLDGEEIAVEMSSKTFPITTSISHNFVRKTFFTLGNHQTASPGEASLLLILVIAFPLAPHPSPSSSAFCECCQRILFHGKRIELE